MRSITLAIPSFQRRDALERALCSVVGDLERDPAIAEGFEVFVVLDGSTDSSEEMLSSMNLGVPLRWHWQPNAGLAAARNSLLELATTDLVWFLDDDMVLGHGAIRRHREGHPPDAGGFVMGPCYFPEDVTVVSLTRSWADGVYQQLSSTGRVLDPHQVSFANTSGPTSLFKDLGGFESRLRGWGGEDVELGFRALRAGIIVRFDPDAVAWHYQARGIQGMCATKFDQGRNEVRLVRLHPEMSDLLIRPLKRRRQRTLLRLLLVAGMSRSRSLASALARVAIIDEALPGNRRALLKLAAEANRLAGVIEMDDDGEVVAQLLRRLPGNRPHGDTREMT